ncbi:MAG TPA: lysylphosphatidylglycerol synthase transmembrane domain-containing protein [Acidobacteriota bacterium]|nr:lysylphosphatidylglycerol synthase transmembrane domain-containing protein [Acidobacteriota bacterium]
MKTRPHDSNDIQRAVPPWRRILQLISAVVIPSLLLYFIVHSIWTQWDQVRAHEWQLHGWWLLAAALLMWVDLIAIILLWRSLLVDVSHRPLSFGSAYRVSTLANLGKYIPGKVWAVMGMVYLLKREGYPAATALASTVLHQAFMVVAGASFLLLVLGVEFLGRFPLLPVIVGLGGSLLVLYPPVFARLLNWGLRLLHRDPVQIPQSFLRAVIRFFLYIFGWVTYGASFWCMMRGIGIAPPVFWEIVAAFGAAYLIGFLALFAPGGLGVREGIITILLAPYLPAGLPAVVAVAARLWTTAIELVGLLPLIGSLRRFRVTGRER